MTPLENLLYRLSGVKKSVNGWAACCPAHDDRRASLSVAEGDDGRVLIRCHAGCTVEAVVAAVGLGLRDLFPPKGGRRPDQPASANGRRVIAATYDYVDEEGQLLYQVVRYDPKDFRQRRPKPGGGWVWKLGDVRRVLYYLPAVREAVREGRMVYICEGEKDCNTLTAWGLTATTNPGGAGKWRPEYTETLRGADAVITPDQDEPGRRHAADVAKALTGVARSVKVVELPGEGKDVSDWAAAGGTREALEALVAQAPLWTPPQDAPDADEHAEGVRRPDNAPGDGQAQGEKSQADARPDTPGWTPWRSYPAEVLPDPIKTYVRSTAAAFGCDPSFLAMPLLTAAGAAVGTTRCLLVKKDWKVYPILWTVLVAESGGLKTPALRAALCPLHQRQAKLLAEYEKAKLKFWAELETWEKEMVSWRKDKGDPGPPPAKPEPPPCVRTLVEDSTIEALAAVLLANPRGVLLARDELSSWLASFDRYANTRGGDAGRWLSCHNVLPVIVDRKTSGTIFIPKAAVAITGGVQPGVLRRALGTEHLENGLAARCLFTCPPRATKRWRDADVDQVAARAVVDVFDGLFSLQHTVDDDGELAAETVELSPDARADYISFYNEHAQILAEAEGVWASSLAKLEETPLRLALVLHLIRWAAGDQVDPMTVDQASMAAALALAKWHTNENQRIYVLVLGDADREQARLLDFIARRGGRVTPREVQQHCRWLRQPGAAEGALEKLVRDSLGEWVIEAGPGPGRPKRVFALSTSSTSTKFKKTTRKTNCADVDSVDVADVDAADAWGGPADASSGEDDDDEELF